MKIEIQFNQLSNIQKIKYREVCGYEYTGNTLKATIQEYGFPTIEEFARFHALDILEHKLEMYEKQLGGYEKKYGIPFQDFETKSSEIVTQSILEKEDDFIEWESILHRGGEDVIEESSEMTLILVLRFIKRFIQ